jgi:hypothetical protein
MPNSSVAQPPPAASRAPRPFSYPAAIDEHIRGGERLCLDMGTAREEYVLWNERGHVAARQGVSPVAHVQTCDGTWQVGVERLRRIWGVVARVPSTGDAVACCYPRWRPASYHVWVAPDDWYRLRVGLVRSAWTLRDDDRVQVASFAIGREGLPDRIQTATDATRIRQLGLLVMVSLEAILRQPNVPAEVGGAGG